MSYTNFDFPHTHFYDTDLRELIKYMKAIVEDVETFTEWKNKHEPEYQELKKFMDDINNGDLPPALYNEMHRWFNENAFDIVGEMVKHVYFGLNDDGYFVVYIPENWKEVEFRTSEYDYFTPIMTEYGHLLLLY